MSRYYTWRQAWGYDTRLRRFSTGAVVDAARLCSVKTREGGVMMIDTMSTMLSIAEKREAQIARVAEKIYSAAQSSAVYSEPVTTGNYTVITASEIVAVGGFGTGSGFGSPTIPPMQPGETAQPQAQPLNSAGGVGGGGGSSGRPVAIIIIGPDGVTVKPVVDVTRIALASVTVGGAMVMRLWRMRKARRRMYV